MAIRVDGVARSIGCNITLRVMIKICSTETSKAYGAILQNVLVILKGVSLASF